MNDNNYTHVYNTEPSNKQFVSVLPHQTHAVCHTATELYTSFVRLALACGISSDWAQYHEEMPDISLCSTITQQQRAQKRVSASGLRHQEEECRSSRNLSRAALGSLASVLSVYLANNHTCSISFAVFFLSNVPISKHSFNVYELLTFEMKVLILWKCLQSEALSPAKLSSGIFN